jgi:hypothetical protein
MISSNQSLFSGGGGLLPFDLLTLYALRFTDIGKLWLEERTPEQLKGEGSE